MVCRTMSVSVHGRIPDASRSTRLLTWRRRGAMQRSGRAAAVQRALGAGGIVFPAGRLSDVADNVHELSAPGLGNLVFQRGPHRLGVVLVLVEQSHALEHAHGAAVERDGVAAEALLHDP